MKFPVQALPIARQAAARTAARGLQPSSIQCSLCHLACEQISNPLAKQACHLACEHTVC